MVSDMIRLEKMARTAMGDNQSEDPLPPAPGYGPFGYFRLAVLVFAAFVAVLLAFTMLG